MRATGVRSRSWLFVSVVALATALALGVAPSAQAANIAPNPGFETGGPGCDPGPCQWSAFVNSTILRDPVGPHSGAFSIRLTSTGTQTIVWVRSDCVAATAGTYNMAIFYKVDAGQAVPPTNLQFQPTFYSGVGCSVTQTAGGGTFTDSPVNDGMWHYATGQATAPAGTQSAVMSLVFHCGVPPFVTCPNTSTASFDDAVIDTSPLAAAIVSLSARRSSKGVLVRWRTGTEANELGFNVYRQQGRRRVRVNRRLLPAIGGVAGTSYAFTDRRAPRHRALRYWLQDVELTGARTWHGPVRVAAS